MVLEKLTSSQEVLAGIFEPGASKRPSGCLAHQPYDRPVPTTRHLGRPAYASAPP